MQTAPEPNDFHQAALDILRRAGTPFLVGGAYAFRHYTGIWRDTKDIDFFLMRENVEAALRHFSAAGFQTEILASHWLGKVHHFNNKDFCDIIYGSGNGLCVVDQEWFQHAQPGIVLNTAVCFSPAEEMIWQKAFIMERERYDGADVAHLLRAQGQTLCWDRLLGRFHNHSHVLLSHVILLAYIYPGEQLIPDSVEDKLREATARESHASMSQKPVCRGTLLSRSQYSVDIDEWGYQDARVLSRVMTAEEAATWTAAANEEQSKVC